MIIQWPLAILAIPAGWTLCDGTLGTPNLINFFIVGAGDTYAVGSSGGGNIHRHTSAFDTHGHSIDAGAAIAAGADYEACTSEEELTGFTNYANNVPPYYALVFIMKL